MENLVSPEMVSTIVGGALVTILVTLIKKYFSRFNTRSVVLVVSILLGTLYFAFNAYVPVLVRDNIINFVYGALTTGVFIYSFIVKGFLSEDKK